MICAAVYLLLYTGSMYEFCENARGKAMFYPVLFLSSERVFSGLSVVMLPSAKNNGLAAAHFPRLLRKSWIRKILLLSLALLAVAGFWDLGRMQGTGSLWSLPGASGSAFCLGMINGPKRTSEVLPGTWPDFSCRQRNWAV